MPAQKIAVTVAVAERGMTPSGVTIDTGEMLDSIALAEWPSCVSSQDSKAGSCWLATPKVTVQATRDAGC